MPEHLPEIRRLLSQDDAVSVQQGISLLQSLADSALWALYAEDVELEVGLDIVIGSEIETHVASGFRADVAFWALRETGQLDGKTQLRLSECRLLTDLRPLIGLTALESLDLSDCPSLTSLDGIEHLPTLRALELSNCSAVDLAPLRQLPRLTSLRLANRTTLTTLAALDGLTCLESLDVSGCSSLTSLDGLDRFPALREVRLDGCDGLKSLAELPPTVRIARTPDEYEDAFPVRHEHHTLWMSETEGQLRLNGLTSVSPLEAKALVAAAGTLALDGLRVITDEVATILSRQGGRLSLNGIETLSAKAAAALATTHSGDLMLRDLEVPTDADEIFKAHSGRVALGSAFQYIDVGHFDASQDIETYGERVDATPLTFPIEEECTFTLKHQVAWPIEVKAGVLDDATVAALLEEDADPLDWWDYDNIVSAYGVTEPATTLILPDGTEQEVCLRYWPRSCHLTRQVQRQSERGDFVHITHSSEKGAWHAYSVTLPEGVFDLARVRVSWEGDFVDGYDYVHHDGTIDTFESDDEVETRGKGEDQTIFFHSGTALIPIDIDDLKFDLEESGVDAADIDAVRTFLLERADHEAASRDETSADDRVEDSDSSADGQSEESWKAEQVQDVAQHLETWGFGPSDTGWLGRVLQGYASGEPVNTPMDLGPHYSRIRCIIQLTDGTLVSAADEGVLRFWDPTSLRCIRSVDTGKKLGPLLALSDGRFIADIGDSCTVWEGVSDAPRRTLDLGDDTLATCRKMGEREVATSDGAGSIRIWDTSTWAVRITRHFDDLRDFTVLDATHLLVETMVYPGDDEAMIHTYCVWNTVTDHVLADVTDGSGPRSTAVLPGRGWATTDGGTRILIRDTAGAVLQTIDPPLRTANVNAWTDDGAYTSCGGTGIVTLTSDVLLIWGARQTDGAFVILRCELPSGTCTELIADSGVTDTFIFVEARPLSSTSVLVRLPADRGEVRSLLVSADADRPLLSLILPRGRPEAGSGTTDESDIHGALLLENGRIATWGGWHDHAIRFWTAEGVTAGTIGRVSRFRTRDTLETTLLGAPE